MKSPAFQFYPAEFLSDEHVILMSNQEIGCYIKLMCLCWREGSIPADVNKIAKLCGETGEAMAHSWLAISDCFAQAKDNALRLVHPRLEKERNKQNEHKKERSSAGKKGAEARWHKEYEVCDTLIAEPMAEPMANDASSSSTSSSTVVLKPLAAKRGKQLPDEFHPNGQHIEFADTNSLQIGLEFSRFSDYHRAKGSVMKDWDAALRTWLRNAVEFAKKSPNAKPAKFDPVAYVNQGRKADAKLIDIN